MYVSTSPVQDREKVHDVEADAEERERQKLKNRATGKRVSRGGVEGESREINGRKERQRERERERERQ